MNRMKKIFILSASVLLAGTNKEYTIFHTYNRGFLENNPSKSEKRYVINTLIILFVSFL